MAENGLHGRMLSSPQNLTFLLTGEPPDAGYAISMSTGALYRNGERSGRVLSLRSDDATGGVWVDYEALPGTQLAALNAIAEGSRPDA